MEQAQEITGLGGRLKAIRTEKGLTQAGLAELIKCGPNDVGRWERDEVSPTLATMERIASALGIKVHELLVDKEANESSLALQGDFEDVGHMRMFIPPNELVRAAGLGGLTIILVATPSSRRGA